MPPSRVDKLVPVEGDILKLRLGLSDTDYTTLTEKVSIVFHVAATVRFNETLSKAILINVRATREVVNLCLNMKQLLVCICLPYFKFARSVTTFLNKNVMKNVH